MEITGTIEVPDLNRDGYILDGGLGVVRGNRRYKTWYWEDWASYTFSTSSTLPPSTPKTTSFWAWWRKSAARTWALSRTKERRRHGVPQQLVLTTCPAR